MLQTDRPAPSATYRLQFHSGFGFRAALDILPYLARLGISHVYASPFLKARPGSTHGYDIVDHGALNPELGSLDDFRAFAAGLKSHGLGLILDFVPNHMGVGGADNPFWLDVLEWGSASDFAGWFDIDWHPGAPHLEGKLLAPVLGDHYGRVLEDGGLTLRFEPETGAFAVWAYGEHKLPIRPSDYGRILGTDHDGLERLGDAFTNLHDYQPHQRRRAGELKNRLAALVQRDSAARQAIDAVISRYSGVAGDLASWARLDGLIAGQHWRVAFFRVAADDINYRRFFNINDLAGIRIEHRELFDHAHRFVFELIAEGLVDGLRIDHIDGLLDPAAYCQRLREATPRPVYLVVEKILGDGEDLRRDWGVDGTTGYEFANLVSAFLTDPEGQDRLTALYRAFTGDRRPFAEIARSAKLGIMQNEMASELETLARDAARVARSNPRTADFTQNVLRRALREVIASFAVYRTYFDRRSCGDADSEELGRAIATARRNARDLDPSVFDFLGTVLGCRAIQTSASGFSRQQVLRLAMKFQQYTGPVMAKGVEDTAFYRYNRLLSANEVGGNPEKPTVSVCEFHAANARRLELYPRSMLGTSTHDTKRGEDARMRLAALPEFLDEFERLVAEWTSLLRPKGGSPFDRNDEYALYQLLLAAWPPELEPQDEAGLQGLRERLAGVLTKSIREAKLHTTWAAPNEDYETASLAFLADALSNRSFLASFRPFQRQLQAAGAANSLVQLVLKLTLPGVPDIYQGAELWELSLVDPDNRRPVDFDLRRRLLDDSADEPALGVERLTRGSGKLIATHRLLDLRQRMRGVFAEGSYEPIDMPSPLLAAYRRRHGHENVTVVIRRFPTRFPHIDRLDLGITGKVMECLTGRSINLAGDGVTISDLFAGLPAAVLVQPDEVDRRANASSKEHP